MIHGIAEKDRTQYEEYVRAVTGGDTMTPCSDPTCLLCYFPVGAKNLRDEFATAALIGLLASGQATVSPITELAYDYADMMLKHRERPHGPTHSS